MTLTLHGTKRDAEDFMHQLLVEVGGGGNATTEG